MNEQQMSGVSLIRQPPLTLICKQFSQFMLNLLNLLKVNSLKKTGTGELPAPILATLAVTLCTVFFRTIAPNPVREQHFSLLTGTHFLYHEVCPLTYNHLFYQS